MPNIIFIEHNGTRHNVTTTAETTVMQAAKDNGVPGILADCGGACACATCHVIVDPEWASRLKPITEIEDGMLEYAMGREATSRLSCQVNISDELDGMVVRIPAEQT